jgi:peptide/nickel transport system substrate-binding protein
MQTRKMFTTMCTIGMILMGLFGLWPEASRAGSSAAALNQIVLGSLEEPGSLSALVDLPHHFPEHAPQTLLYDSLTQFMPDGTVRPKLAQKWTVSPNSLVYTFTLAPNAKFHDGTRITAADVKFTFDAARDPKTQSSDEGLETVKSVEVLTPRTVRVTLTRVTPQFLAEGGARGIVPKHLLEGKDLSTDAFNQKPIGSGPYRLVSFTPGQSIVLEAVPDFYRGAAKIRRVIFKVVPDQNVILTQLRSGEIQYALLQPRDLAAVQNTAGLRVVESPTPRFYDITMNFQRPYWQDKRVREAVLRAMDREGIVQKVLLGHGQVVHANATTSSWVYTSDVPRYPYDPARAKQLLDDAGWRPGSDGVRTKGGQRLRFTVMLKNFDRTLEQVFVIAQQQLQPVGVDLQIERVEPGVFPQRMRAGNFDALSRVWNPVYDPDQSNLLRTGNRYGGYSNPQVDALLDRTLATLDRAKRKQAFMALQRLLSQDLARLYLYTENELHVVPAGLRGVEWHPVNIFWNLKDWELGR